MAKESLVVHVRKLLFKKYMKNHKLLFFFFNKVQEKKITEKELIYEILRGDMVFIISTWAPAQHFLAWATY